MSAKLRKGYTAVPGWAPLRGAVEARVWLLQHTFSVGQPDTNSATWSAWVSGRRMQVMRDDLVILSCDRAAGWVPVVITRFEAEPPRRDEPWCAVSEIRLYLNSGELSVAVPFNGPKLRFSLPPSRYGLRVYLGDQSTAEYDGDTGDDHYRFELWPAEPPEGLPVPLEQPAAGGAASPERRAAMLAGDVCERVHATHHTTDRECLERLLAEDPSDNVRVAAAAALARLGALDAALMHIDHPDVRARLVHDLRNQLELVDASGRLGFLSGPPPNALDTDADWAEALAQERGFALAVPPGAYIVTVEDGEPAGAQRFQLESRFSELHRWHRSESGGLYPLGQERGALSLNVAVEPGAVFSRVRLFVRR